MEAKLKSYFERYPKNDEVFENGGILFHNKGAADSFGKSETKGYTRAEVTTPQSPEGEVNDTDNVELTDEQKQAAQGAAELVKAEMEKLKVADIENMDYNEMKRLVSLFKLSSDDNKKETLIAVLTEFKKSFNTPE